MILADTSAWVEYDRATGSVVDLRLAGLIAAGGPVAVTEPVIMEVLAGARSDAREADLRRLLLRFHLCRFDAVAEAGRALGRLDIVVNNAGIGAAGTVEDNDDAEWHRVLDVNVLGIVRTTRAALPLLRRAARERGQAAIVNTCSVAAIAGLPQRALYSATKGAVYSLTLAMAADHVAEGIRVNCVTPGTADTPWVGRLLDAAPDPAAERAALNARQPMGRLVSADEVAAAIAYLASPLAGATTGTALAVDGGMQGLRIRPRPT